MDDREIDKRFSFLEQTNVQMIQELQRLNDTIEELFNIKADEMGSEEIKQQKEMTEEEYEENKAKIKVKDE